MISGTQLVDHGYSDPFASLVGGVSKETGIPDGFMGLDCGPKSIEENAQAACHMTAFDAGSVFILSSLNTSK